MDRQGPKARKPGTLQGEDRFCHPKKAPSPVKEEAKPMRFGYVARPRCAVGCIPCAIDCSVGVTMMLYWKGELERLLDFQPEPWEDGYRQWADEYSRGLANLERYQRAFRASRLSEPAPRVWLALQQIAAPDPRILH